MEGTFSTSFHHHQLLAYRGPPDFSLSIVSISAYSALRHLLLLSGNRYCCWFNSINSTAGQRKNNTFDFQSSCPFKYPLLFKHNIEIHLYLMKILSNNNAISNPYPLRRIYLAWEESVFVQHPLCVASTCNLVLYLIVIMQIPFKSQRYIL